MLESKNLLLRRWRDSDLEPFAQMGADPQIMEFFPALLSKEQVAEAIKKIELKFTQDGFCFWACEEKQSQAFVGIVGISRLDYETPFTPCIEVGWRIARSYWGKGFATEAGLRALEFGFLEKSLPEIVAQTAAGNLKSRRVMEKLGMLYSPREDFDHPKVPENNPHRKHVLYRLTREQFLSLKR